MNAAAAAAADPTGDGWAWLGHRVEHNLVTFLNKYAPSVAGRGAAPQIHKHIFLVIPDRPVAAPGIDPRPSRLVSAFNEKARKEALS